MSNFTQNRDEPKLKGKKLILSFTTGAPEAMYLKDGPVGYTIEDFPACYKATCRLTGMDYGGSVHTCGVSHSMRTKPQLVEEQKRLSKAHADRLIKIIETL